MTVTNEQVITKAREIIAIEGSVVKHNLIHKICIELDCFGEIDGNLIDSLDITNNEFPMYRLSRNLYTYIAEAPEVPEELI